MDKHRLEELKRLSMPAIRHAELVELARSHSPSQTQKLARSAGWPSRQVKAVRSLSILRRDHENEVFENFIATMERARTEKAVTEQAQDNRRTGMKNRTAKNLERVKDPIARLRLATKNGLKEQALEIIASLIEKWKVFFWTDQDGEILFNTLKKDPDLSEFENMNNLRSPKRQQNLISFFPPKENRSSLVIDFDGMIDYFELDAEKTKEIVCAILEKTIAKAPIDNWRLLWATTRMCREYLNTDETLATATEIWLLQSHLRSGKLFELRRKALPLQMKRAEDECDELNPIVDRFLELGWTMDEVKAEFIFVIQKAVSNCRPQFMLALAGAKCFTREDYVKGEVGKLLREKYRPWAWECLTESKGDYWPKIYCQLLRCGLTSNYRDREDMDFYRQEFIKLLAQGKLNRVWQLILIIGPHILFYAELESRFSKEAEKYLTSLTLDAYRMAYENGNFGVAAALSQQFNILDEEKIEIQADDSVRKEYVELFGEQEGTHNMRITLKEGFLLTDRNGNILSDEEYCEESVEGKPPDEEARQRHFNLIELGKVRQKNLERFRAEALKERGELVELALSLDQPIGFTDVLSYYVVPNWPEH